MSSFETKFQAGEAYGDDDKDSDIFADPLKLANDILKDCGGLRKEASPKQIASLLQELVSKGPLDDKKGNTELLIGILTSLPSDSKVRTQLTNKLIDTLWDNLQHPPLSYLGGDVKYEVVDSQESKSDSKTYNSIEFKVPDSDVTLREHVPQAPDGLHHYRTPDGSYNNPIQPNLGRAGAPYAKSVRNTKRLHGVKPDPGLLFDLLMARDDQHFIENPAGISAMFFYHASIIIHDIFRTNRTDPNRSDTSSYLDLAPLYGSSLKDQLEIRTMKGGKLKPDTFHEKRLIGQPAGVNVMLVLYSRFHNYVCDVLLQINENGRFTLECDGKDNATPEEKARALARQDHDLFNVARLIVGGMYINISLHDYLRAITNTHHSKSDWTLDPRVEIKAFDGEGAPRGVGNQVSAEFNLLYRFHSCISKKDERWMNDFFLKLFPPDNQPKDLSSVSLEDFGLALLNYERSINPDPSKREFGDIKRQADGTFKNEDLVRILKEAMDDPAGVFGARTIPKALKIIEILGINQARKWQVASLNEFREFFGLKRYEKFTDINSEPEIANILEKLYTDPDMVELYPGMMIEDAKPIRNAGCGISPTYSVGRAVLSDAVTLVRSDRFNTLDYTVSNLTSWGYNEVQSDNKTLGGSMLYKLIQRGVPGWFPYNSVAVMQPMYTKKANEKIAKEFGTIDQYTLDDPQPPRKSIVVFTSEAIKRTLGQPKQFVVPWLPALNTLFPGKKDFSWYMLAGDEQRNFDDRATTLKAIQKIPNLLTAVNKFVQRVGFELIEKERFTLKEGLDQIDLIRDVAIPLNTQLLADLFYMDLKTDENPNGSLGVAELYGKLLDIRTWGVNNTDPAQSWNRRRRAQEGLKTIIDKNRKLIDEVAHSLGFGMVTNTFNDMLRKHDLRTDSLRSCGYKLAKELLAQGYSAEKVTDSMWLNAFGGIGVPVTAFYEVMEFFLRKENEHIWNEVQKLAKDNNDKELYAYVLEAQRLTSTQRNMRVATQPATLDGQTVEPGNLVVMLLGEAGRNPAEVPNAHEFDPQRQIGPVSSFSYGQHECLAKEIARSFITGMVKLAADLKELRPAPGEMGKVKTIKVGTETNYLNDSWSYLCFEASTWKLHFNGRGLGNFKGKEQPGTTPGLLQYYHTIQKRKNELLN